MYLSLSYSYLACVRVHINQYIICFCACVSVCFHAHVIGYISSHIFSTHPHSCVHMHAAGACVGAIEYGFRWAELLRCSFLRIQPLTWYPVGSGGSLRLGAPQGSHGVLTGTPSAPAAACASVRPRVLTGYSRVPRRQPAPSRATVALLGLAPVAARAPFQ